MLSLLMTKQGIIGAGIILALMAGVAWLNGAIRAAEARGEAEEMARVTRLEFEAVIDSINNAWAERDAAWKAENAALRDSLGRQVLALSLTRENAARATGDARRAIADLSGKVDSLTQIALDQASTAIDSLEEAERQCNDALGTCQDLVRAADARIWDLEARQRQTLDLTRNQAITIDRLRDLRQSKMNAAGYLGWAVAIGEAAYLIVAAVTGS